MTQNQMPQMAPELEVETWINVDKPLSLSALRGKVIVIEAFQMLCPGCVSHSLPQAMKVAQTFSSDDVAVIGLHTVFEHHSAQGTREALSAFMHEYRITFPVAIDKPSKNDPIPHTMKRYQMRGTPSLILIDREGYLRKHAFGRADDLALGAEIMALVQEQPRVQEQQVSHEQPKSNRSKRNECDNNGCPVPDTAS